MIGHGHIDSYYGSLYATAFNNYFFMNAALIGAFDQFAASRKIQFPTIDRKASTHHNGATFTAHLDLGMIITVPMDFEIRPFGSFDYNYLYEQAFTEKGADSLDLHVRKKNYTMVRSETGLNLAKCVSFKHRRWIVELRGSWVRETRLSGRHTTASFKGQPGSFTVHGLYPNRSLFSPGASVTCLFNEGKAAFILRYDGEFGSHFCGNVGQAQFTYS